MAATTLEDAKREAQLLWDSQADATDCLGVIIVNNDDPRFAIFTYPEAR